MKGHAAKPEADRDSFGSYPSVTAAMIRIEANLQRIERLPTKRFWLALVAAEITLGGGVGLFSEELKALIGIQDHDPS